VRDKLLGMLLILAIGSLFYLHMQTEIEVIECSDGTFTQRYIFEKLESYDPTYMMYISCESRSMTRSQYYDESSLRKSVKR